MIFSMEMQSLPLLFQVLHEWVRLSRSESSGRRSMRANLHVALHDLLVPNTARREVCSLFELPLRIQTVFHLALCSSAVDIADGIRTWQGMVGHGVCVSSTPSSIAAR